MIEVKKPEAVAIEYPVARRYRSDGMIVIFWSEELGTIVHAGTSRFPMEFKAERWTPCTDEDVWEPVDVHIYG
ncbi:hypothetical protein BHC46_10695 [Snodgrassella alvi]|uniref:Uncharacterized protein n=1 Tax=Snodgrassella alvi TaxID=1196083 RepID=A0A2N9XC73_9NEIS|nr:hypothetical protein [Snodgrassella alvi]PIT44246.1 hypothetical protein BHC46_10695 [Snodgrassella alvi]